nr:MAG TPA: hypothetical protein [Caudoviricetes sp.]
MYSKRKYIDKKQSKQIFKVKLYLNSAFYLYIVIYIHIFVVK